MNHSRRSAVPAAASMLAMPRANAQPAYPGRAVRIIIGTPPGDSADANARALAIKLSSLTGQSFFVDNKPGAHGIIAAEAVKNAAPDGYTLLLSTPGAWPTCRSATSPRRRSRPICRSSSRPCRTARACKPAGCRRHRRAD